MDSSPARSGPGGPAFSMLAEADDEDWYGEPLPAVIGPEDRRLQVRACRLWEELRGTRALPAIRDLDALAVAAFAPFSALFDVTRGTDDPAIVWVGESLAQEAAAEPPARTPTAPGDSLLGFLAGFIPQVLESRAPVDFEAELDLPGDRTLLCRGALLPFSGIGTEPAMVWGAVTWKEAADRLTAAALEREVRRALAAGPWAGPTDKAARSRR